jgi:mono/diheme cytochrome c family protein
MGIVMIKSLAAGALMIVLSTLVGTAADLPVIEQGKSIVTHNCSRCHAIGPRGASRDPRALPLHNLATRYPIESLEEALAEGIVAGHSSMPELTFSSTDVGAIIAYLRTIQRR